MTSISRCTSHAGLWRCQSRIFHSGRHSAIGASGTTFRWGRAGGFDLSVQRAGEQKEFTVDELVDLFDDARDSGPSPGPDSNVILGMTGEEQGAWLRSSGRSYGVLTSVDYVPARLLGHEWDGHKRRTLGNRRRRKAYGRKFG